ncbi:hypothetical protein KAFR_0G02930 [Kazachstania africana CBS 2517]|uniref:Structural maintenance of chromosomes protein n=1 Tax=Kazachstania africana (strain ATCC 22294 / BCRC 22015 / CBS 2517 / CECT 1963 / NBRC 1671 / NRRL Y-8276) TaxID=1071382 RepID=H2AY75_KAZAF|nr:hypothetical protein KAFR_0G02930 [Kazachstania africana CBS 2517]CCF59325.1 hypothetical protein KAFR_0G02930 [Kazachstania africana CBS 2517]
MKIEELIIDGFKSYAARTVISDWDPQFNAITGLNGSGKSNILDAICFVLGISSMSTVRASNLQDLIYKRGQAGVTKASVTVVFDNSDRDNSPIGFTNSPKISVTRQVVLGGTSKYLINGHRAPQQSVLQLFQSVQLNINNPNFLIMQGKITKVLNMKPTEILSLIEEAAGTKMFEDRREKAERTMAKKETKLQENRALLAEEIEPKLEKLRSEKRIFLDFQTTQTDLERTSRVVSAFNYYNMKHRQSSFEQTLQDSEDKCNHLKEEIEKVSEEIKSLNEDLEELKLQKKNEMDNEGRLVNFEKEESDLLKQISRIKTTLSIKNDSIDEAEKELQKLNSNNEELTKELEMKLAQYTSTEKEYEIANSELTRLKELQGKKSELLSTLSTGISSNGATDDGYSAQLVATKKKLNDTEVLIKKLNMKRSMLQKELASNEPKLFQAKREHEKSSKIMEQNEKYCGELRSQLASFGYDPDLLKFLRKEESEVQQQLYRANEEAEALKRRVANIEFNYTRPSANFDPKSVKGVAAQLFTVDQQQFDNAIALQVCAGGRLYNIIVDNEITASQLLERGRLKKRVTIIPLSKIATRTLNKNTLALAKELAPGKVELALNLIGYDDEVSKAMEFIFGNGLVCKDADTAKKVTFHPNIRTRSITQQGDVYDPEGTLSGGSRNTTRSLLVDIQKYNHAVAKVNELELKLIEMQKKLKEQEETSQKTKSLQNELNLADHKLNIAQRRLVENSAAQIIKRNKELHEELQGCEEQILVEKKNASALEIEIETTKKDAEEFSKDKNSKLSKLKNEIEKLNKAIEDVENKSESLYDLYQNLQLETEQLANEIKSNKEMMEQTKANVGKLEEEKVSVDSHLQELNTSLIEVQTRVKEERARLLGIDEELKELESLVKSKQDTKSQHEIDLKKITNETNSFRQNSTNLQANIEKLIDEHEWLQDMEVVKGIVNQYHGINLQEYTERQKQLHEKFSEMKRKVNPNIMSMIENVEKKETALKTMIRTIEKDKMKIQETIGKLNEYKRETLIKTWEKVTNDFGKIFEDLLPNSFAKLVPCEGKDVTEGLEVKVRLGTIWKESLVELSGGQRSLIALSLIMALLQFRPAPMYILDEVDAALDLSHTQNIGHLIKTRFKGSQFIVVSLKEGMFNNANRVFRTRFQDGTSVVSIM